MIDFVWQKTRAVCLSPFATMRERKWPFALILTFLVACEFFLPVRGQAQSFSDTGTFYFTQSHNPLRSPIFREFMGGPGVGDGVKAGPVRVHPFLGVAEVYTDNVFRVKGNGITSEGKTLKRESDFLTTIAPGIQALLPFGGGRHSVLLDYRAAQFLYKKFSENNVLAQDAQGHVSLNYPGGLAIDLQGGHIEGFDSRGSEIDSRQQDITKWNTNSFLGQVEFSGQKAGIRFRPSYLALHFKNNGQAPRRDRTRARADVTLFANVTHSTSALLGFQITNTTYDKNKQLDSFSYRVFSGFRLAPTRQLSGEFNIGLTVLNFDRAPIPAGTPKGDDLEDKDLSLGGKQQQFLSMRGNVFWNPTSRLSIGVLPFRTIRQSAVFDTSTFIQTGVSITGRQALTDRIALRGNFFFANDDFEDSRNDNRFRWRMGVEYRTVKFLGFRLDYLFERRNSSESDFDFYSNTVMLSIQGIL